MTHPVHDLESAPAEAQETLAKVRRRLGFVPNLLGTMADAPPLLDAYLSLASAFEQTSFDATERQVVLLAASRANACEYCVAAHTVIAAGQGVADGVLAALRAGEPLQDGKLEALRRFTVAVVVSRGWPDPAAQQAFQAAGYGPRQALEVVLGVGLKTLSNYTNHLAGTRLDDAFAGAAWSADAATPACEAS
ncbi:MAG: carboxymuconolactone decarboxylase family protein [Planctomycetes bacterium]|nr:carboxymuconolactone decarboxylase family protein [Planctomycetota bacterium]